MKSKLFSLIVSVLAAMCLWVYVMTVVNPDVDLVIGNIPVTFSGAEVLQEDHGLVITGDYQEFVSVHFYGKNADLKTLDQHKDEIKAVVDVSKVRSTKEYTMTYDITLPSAVSASSITRADKNPTNITFTVERQIRKSVEVKGDFSNVRIAEGFMLDSTSFDYDSITVEGPESIVGTIDCAQVTLDRSNVDKTITETVSYVLLDKDGNQVDTSELTLSADAIDVTMKIVKYKVVPLEVEFIDGGGAKAETDVTYTADIQAVTLSGDVTVLDGLNSIQLEPIDLSTLSSNDETITRTILIPNDVKNVSGQEEVSIHVIIHGKQIKTLRTTNIVFIGVDEEKFKATSLSQQVQVTIRADASDAQKILAGNIRIVADMRSRLPTPSVWRSRSACMSTAMTPRAPSASIPSPPTSHRPQRKNRKEGTQRDQKYDRLRPRGKNHRRPGDHRRNAGGQQPLSGSERASTALPRTRSSPSSRQT